MDLQKKSINLIFTISQAYQIDIRISQIKQFNPILCFSGFVFFFNQYSLPVVRWQIIKLKRQQKCKLIEVLGNYAVNV